MSWVLLVGIAWTLLALPAALLLGRAMRPADGRKHTMRGAPVPAVITTEAFLAALTAPGRR
jgi:hypothetical protein